MAFGTNKDLDLDNKVLSAKSGKVISVEEDGLSALVRAARINRVMGEFSAMVDEKPKKDGRGDGQ